MNVERPPERPLRVLHLTAGTGSWYCGTCIRDNALVRGLRALGHEADLVPMYLPIVAEGEAMSAGHPIQFGGISCYLEQTVPAWRDLPLWVDDWLRARPLLKLAGTQAGSTRPEDTGAMTLSMLLGDRGHQSRELDRLLRWLALRPRYDVVVLSNSLLAGLAAPLRRNLQIPVVCTLQGELYFVDAMGEPWRDRVWAKLAGALWSCDGLVAVSDFAADAYAARAGVPRDALEVVLNGVDLDSFPEPEPADPPTLGFLARLYRGKGIDRLMRAFVRLRARHPELRLALAGTQNAGDVADLRDAMQIVEEAGLQGLVTVQGNLSPAHKRGFLRRLTVFSVPIAKDDTGGLYAAEALAAGLPSVFPRRGALPEIVGDAARLVPPDDEDALVEALDALLRDADARADLSARARDRARHLSETRMATEFAAVLREAVARHGAAQSRVAATA